MGIFFGRNKRTEEPPSTTVTTKVEEPEEPCERWREDNVKSSTIASHLLSTFGTTDLNRVIEVAKNEQDNAKPSTIASHLLSTFGTTDLNRVAELFLSEKNREKLKA